MNFVPHKKKHMKIGARAVQDLDTGLILEAYYEHGPVFVGNVMRFNLESEEGRHILAVDGTAIKFEHTKKEVFFTYQIRKEDFASYISEWTGQWAILNKNFSSIEELVEFCMAGWALCFEGYEEITFSLVDGGSN